MAAKDADLARDFLDAFVYINNDAVAAFEIELLATPQMSAQDSHEELYLVGSLGTVLEIEELTTPHATGGLALPPIEPTQKSQFISAEPLDVVLRPFLGVDGSLVVSGADVITITLKAPDTTIYNPTAVWDSTVNMWVAQLDSVNFQEGEWLLYAISSVGSALPQFASLWWGDYVDDIPETRQGALGRWKIEGTTLRLYEEDNVTIFKEFALKDNVGDPSNTSIFDKDPL